MSKGICTLPPNLINRIRASGKNRNNNKSKRNGTKGAFGKSKALKK